MDEKTRDTTTLHRLLFFSDAVFAIVLTLLVLELRPPEGAESGLDQALIGMIPHFVAFFSSFGLISIFWLGHVSILRQLTTFDWPVAGLNLVFLLVIALMPFVSGLIGEYGTNGESWRVYCGVLIAASLVQTALLLTASRDNGRLFGQIDGREKARRTGRALSPAIVFGAGLALSLNGQPGLASVCWLLFIPIVIAIRLLFSPRKAAKTAPA